MRFLKKLLVSIYVFLALFVIYCCIIFTLYQTEPQTLIVSVMAGVGVESILAGFIKFAEEKEARKNRNKIKMEDINKEN